MKKIITNGLLLLTLVALSGNVFAEEAKTADPATVAAEKVCTEKGLKDAELKACVDEEVKKAEVAKKAE